VNGTTWNLEPWVVVDWRWMSYPYVVWLLATAFVIVVMGTSRMGVPLWRSSQIPLLYCRNGPVSSATQAELVAAERAIVLEWNEEVKDWTLVERGTVGEVDGAEMEEYADEVERPEQHVPR
jgi:hypothetical protein